MLHNEVRELSLRLPLYSCILAARVWTKIRREIRKSHNSREVLVLRSLPIEKLPPLFSRGENADNSCEETLATQSAHKI